MTTGTGKGKIVAMTAALLLCLFHGIAFGDFAWKASFDETCSKTDQAMTLSVKELNTLLEKCSALEKVIETQDESVRKVYMKRLQLCKNLYSYVLEYKKNNETSKAN